jgi:flagellar biosynthesis anti-sigma factor FlgM
MKINQSTTFPTSKTQSSAFGSTRPDGNSSSSGRTEDTGDKIDLNSQASLLSQAQSAGASERSANIDRLRALVQSGQYQVDTGALSHSIVNSAIAGY